MAKASPQQSVFEGELSPLAEGRTDVDRYPRSMRYMSNMVPCRTGPAIGRSGLYFENLCANPLYPSKLLDFEFNEDEAFILEFSHFRMRIFYEYSGVVAHREATVLSITTTNPFVFTVNAHNWVANEHLVFSDLDPRLGVNGKIATITNIAGNVITVDVAAFAAAGIVFNGNERAAVVYEITTPYHRDDVKNLRMVQELNRCYLFCFKSDGSGDYPMYFMQRRNTFNWKLNKIPLRDGPYMDINVENTFFIPTGKGTWIPNMTSNILPSGQAAASSQIANHEAFRAFDGNLDSYWESNTSQEGWLEYAFETGFVNQLPVFSGPVAGGMTISATSSQAGMNPWEVSDANGGTDWHSGGDLPQSWFIDLGSSNTVLGYILRASRNREDYAPRNWTLEGSNTGTSGPWTVLDTRVGYTWNSGAQRHFVVQSPGAFRYYRIQVTAVNREHVTTVIPATGTPGKKGYVPAKTVTTLTPNHAGLSQVQMSYGAGGPKVVDGYTIYLGRYNKTQDVIDHAPKTWYFEGYDGANWKLLDTQQGYGAWGNYRSAYFPINNPDMYKKYRIRIKTCVKAGSINPRIGKLVMSSPDTPPITLRASSKVGINDGLGFLPTDVGRLIRLRDADNMWRWTTISAVTDPTHITLALQSDDPLVLEAQVKLWRLGLWSDTTGYPTCGCIHEDRLFVGGAKGFPDTVVGSYLGSHILFVQSDRFDDVFDTHAIIARANNRFMSRIVWIKSSEEALRVGTGKYEFILSAPTDQALSARNLKIRTTTKRGSAVHEPAVVDNDVIFLQKSRRALYAHTFRTSQADVAGSYKAPLMSKLGAHLMQPEVVQIAYQQEPHSVIWGRRSDGSVVAMTYSNDDDIFGGHRHDFSGFVKDLCTVNSPTDRQDSLWAVVMRHVNGQDVHYIERMFRFWDYGDELSDDATFVDSALRYYGTDPTDKVYGLRHLEGFYLTVLADDIIYKGLGPVTNGMLQLERPATTIVAGLPMVMEGEIIMPEVGAEDGTAQGKSKRPHSVVLRLWESARGEVGRWDEDHGELMWTPCEYNYPADANVPFTTLRTVLTKTTVLPGGYGTLGTVRFRQTDPIPFNVVGVYPQTYVEDER